MRSIQEISAACDHALKTGATVRLLASEVASVLNAVDSEITMKYKPLAETYDSFVRYKEARRLPGDSPLIVNADHVARMISLIQT